MICNWFKKKEDPNEEIVLVKYGYSYERRKVEYDADARPFVMICGNLIRLDVTTTRDIVWIKRRKP